MSFPSSPQVCDSHILLCSEHTILKTPPGGCNTTDLGLTLLQERIIVHDDQGRIKDGPYDGVIAGLKTRYRWYIGQNEAHFLNPKIVSKLEAYLQIYSPHDETLEEYQRRRVVYENLLWYEKLKKEETKPKAHRPTARDLKAFKKGKAPPAPAPTPVTSASEQTKGPKPAATSELKKPKKAGKPGQQPKSAKNNTHRGYF